MVISQGVGWLTGNWIFDLGSVIMLYEKLKMNTRLALDGRSHCYSAGMPKKTGS
jgi:hypothetical protein